MNDNKTMDILRRNTDYAFRLAATLALAYGKEPISGRKLSKDNYIPYELTRKLLQTMAKAELVVSTKGPKGGYVLGRNPNEISFKDVIEAVQGKICLNKCLLKNFACPLKGNCPVSGHLAALQEEIDKHLAEKKLSELFDNYEK